MRWEIIHYRRERSSNTILPEKCFVALNFQQNISHVEIQISGQTWFQISNTQFRKSATTATPSIQMPQSKKHIAAAMMISAINPTIRARTMHASVLPRAEPMLKRLLQPLIFPRRQWRPREIMLLLCFSLQCHSSFKKILDVSFIF